MAKSGFWKPVTLFGSLAGLISGLFFIGATVGREISFSPVSTGFMLAQGRYEIGLSTGVVVVAGASILYMRTKRKMDILLNRIANL